MSKTMKTTKKPLVTGLEDKSTVTGLTFTEMLERHVGVFESLVNQDGTYKPNEAKEINNAMGKQIAGRAFILDAYKSCGIKPTGENLMLIPKSRTKSKKK
jgi:hypothetical protein